MEHFTKKLGDYSVSFTSIILPKGFKLFVAVKKDNECIASFEMKQDYYGQWKILLPAPSWILMKEAEIAALIMDEAKKLPTNNKSHFL